MSGWPGQKISKEYRLIALDLVNNQGWTYSRGKKHPVLLPPDKSRPPLRVPTTPSDRRAFDNWIAEVRRRGGIVRKEQKGSH